MLRNDNKQTDKVGFKDVSALGRNDQPNRPKAEITCTHIYDNAKSCVKKGNKLSCFFPLILKILSGYHLVNVIAVPCEEYDDKFYRDKREELQAKMDRIILEEENKFRRASGKLPILDY